MATLKMGYTKMAMAFIAAANKNVAESQGDGFVCQRVLTNSVCGIGTRPPRKVMHLKKKPKADSAGAGRQVSA